MYYLDNLFLKLTMLSFLIILYTLYTKSSLTGSVVNTICLVFMSFFYFTTTVFLLIKRGILCLVNPYHYILNYIICEQYY